LISGEKALKRRSKRKIRLVTTLPAMTGNKDQCRNEPT
jgi:hypothetical protein